MLDESTRKLKKPCKACPFSRACPPGKTGGSDPAIFVGQAVGPFWLPCHQTQNFKDPNWKNDMSVRQCAGAAIFRANVGVAESIAAVAEQLLRLPADTGLVFHSFAELLAHHRQVSIDEAEKSLEITTPRDLLRIELNKIEAKRHITKRPTYAIYRVFRDASVDKEIIKTGLTLDEAREHCKDPETSSKTCTDNPYAGTSKEHWMETFSAEEE